MLLNGLLGLCLVNLRLHDANCLGLFIYISVVVSNRPIYSGASSRRNQIFFLIIGSYLEHVGIM